MSDMSRMIDYELYLVRRLREEMELAKAATDNVERSIHIQACHYYHDLLAASSASLSDDNATA